MRDDYQGLEAREDAAANAAALGVGGVSVAAMFDDAATAQAAIEELRRRGWSLDEVSVLGHGGQARPHVSAGDAKAKYSSPQVAHQLRDCGTGEPLAGTCTKAGTAAGAVVGGGLFGEDTELPAGLIAGVDDGVVRLSLDIEALRARAHRKD